PMTDEEMELMKRDSEFDWDAATKMIDKAALMAELEAMRLADEADKDELGINDADQAALGETDGLQTGGEEADRPFRSDDEDTGEPGPDGDAAGDEELESETWEKENEDKNIENEEDGDKAVAGDSSDDSDSAGADVEAPKKKKSKGRIVLNIILTILIILLVCELAIVGIKFLMPDSAAAEWIDNMTLKIIQWASTKFNFL
ncbi:MAG: hypothetical protein IKS63_00210, partial [Firmicutes bacterium]|nr:hypothetical protein [Bacillota bacterium]